jgi:hypothetical protein
MPNQSTVSYHVGSSVSLAHNRRLISDESHIDYSVDNEVLVRRDRGQLYVATFEQSILDYNAKQTRANRKVDILDADGKTSPSKVISYMRSLKGKEREAILTFGQFDDDTPHETKLEMIKEFWEGWQERNPNLIVLDAVIHLDEAQPHLQVIFLPVYESNQGISKQMSFDRALSEQAGKDYERKKHKFLNPIFEEWRTAEEKIAQRILDQHGIEFIRSPEGRKKRMTTKEYIKAQEAKKELQGALKRLKDENFKLQYEKSFLETSVEVNKVLKDMHENGYEDEYAPLILKATNSYWKHRNERKPVWEALRDTAEDLKKTYTNWLGRMTEWAESLLDRQNRDR